MDGGMAIAGSCVSTTEKPCFWITTSPESATVLYGRYTRKGQIGRLATLASRRWRLYGLIRHGQRHCRTRAESSRL